MSAERWLQERNLTHPDGDPSTEAAAATLMHPVALSTGEVPASLETDAVLATRSPENFYLGWGKSTLVIE